MKNKKTLKLHHLIYQNYRPLKVILFDGNIDLILEIEYNIGIISFINTNDSYRLIDNAFKLILKPLKYLQQDKKICDEINEILEPNGLEINNFLLLKNSLNAVAISWEEMQKVLGVLYREQYDIYGLIGKGLAVDKNTIK